MTSEAPSHVALPQRQRRAHRSSNAADSTDAEKQEEEPMVEMKPPERSSKTYEWGATIEEAFESAVLAMFDYMTERNTIDIDPECTYDCTANGHDWDSLLFNFMDEFLFHFHAEGTAIREVKITKLDRETMTISARGWGEKFNLSKHPQGTEIKAITFSNMQSLINAAWHLLAEARTAESRVAFDPQLASPQPPYHSKMNVLQQRLKYHFQLAEFAEKVDQTVFAFPTALTAADKSLLHDLVCSFGLYDIYLVNRNNLYTVTIYKANPISHPVAVFDRFLAILADFLFNEALTTFEFRPTIIEKHRDALNKLCESLSIYLMYGDDLVTASKTPLATERYRASKEGMPPVLSLHVTNEDVTLVEEVLKGYTKEVEDGEPTAEGTRFTGSIDASRMSLAGGLRGRYYVDQKLKSDLHEFRQRLPAFQAREEVVKSINENRVTIVMGETGSGKTTQIPQFVLDDILTNQSGMVIVTQPRRISAITVADRVAKERGQRPGEEVGHQSGAIRQLLVERHAPTVLHAWNPIALHSDAKLSNVAVIIVDEIHERDCNSDFILIILKQLLAYTRPDLKLVLMSATVQAEQFQHFFKDVSPQGLPPVMMITGTSYPVDEYFLEDAIEWTGYTYDPRDGMQGKLGKRKFEEIAPMVSRIAPGERLQELKKAYESWSKEHGASYSERTLNVVARIETDDPTAIQYDLIVELVAYFDKTQTPGAILIFVPGWAEIKTVMTRLQAHYSNANWTIFPLHSQVNPADQQKVFGPAPEGTRKIIISTNIAESSVTIDDIKFVIDSGVKKEKSYDPSTNMPCLDSCLVAKANALQRKGRARRCQQGVCVHLFSRVKWMELDDYQQPEILRTPLEELCLQIKMLQLGGIQDFLRHAMHPPPKSSVDHAVQLLQDIQALDSDQYLTHLGRLLASLPVHPLVGKMLVYGAMFRVLEPIAIIAAALSRAERQSDHYATLQAFRGWEHAYRQGYDRQYCEQHYLSPPVLYMIKRTKSQYMQTLYEEGFITKRIPDDKLKSPTFSTSSPLDGTATSSSSSSSGGGRGRSRHDDWDDWDDSDRRGGGGFRESDIDSAVNQYADNFAMVAAALQCGLYPNMVWVKGGRKTGLVRQKLFTTDAQVVRIHPGSVNCDATIQGDFMVYFERLRSQNGPIYLLDCSVVNPLPVILSAFDASVTDQNKKDSTLHVNQWMSFGVKGKVGRVLANLRIVVLRRMQDAIVGNHFRKFPDDILRTIVKLLDSQEKHEQEEREEKVGSKLASSAFSGRPAPPGRGGYGSSSSSSAYQDPFANAEMARMQAQAAGWGNSVTPYGGYYARR